MANLEIHLLGGLHIRLGDGAPPRFISGKAPALLAYLAVTRRPHRREALAGLLWGELADDAAANNLRQALTNLRKLAGAHLLITRETVAFDTDAPHFLDVADFADLLRLSRGQPTQQRIGLLRQAIGLYDGDFLLGFYVRDAPDFEEWVLGQRVHLRDLACDALGSLTLLLIENGQCREAIATSARLLALDAWREEAHRWRMLALARCGQTSAALAQFQTCRAILRQEFDVEPSAETTALYERIRAATRGPRHNLPADVTGFVGREVEIGELRGLLASPQTRLLTLLGPGGVGKTRLALEVARACEPMFLNGVWFVSLVTVDNPAALPWALADALGFALSGVGSAQSQLLGFLRGKELLLVLDNFEQLIDPAAPDLIYRILRDAPQVKFLITSRARLNLSAERLVNLAGLPYPPGEATDDAQQYAAVQLFVRRSQRVRPDFILSADVKAAVVRLCQMVAGLPLAIELAAAWSRTLTPAEIAAELTASLASLASTARDLPERHRSLAAVFEHSWRLLDGTTQTTLMQLAICRGGFDLAAAQAVAAASPTILQALTDHSLLRADAGGRFDMHPLVQQFALEKLVQGSAAVANAARDRHARHFARLTGQHEHQFHGEQDRQALGWMLQEAENVRAAWEWAVAQADPALLEPFLESFLYFFDIQGRYAECVELTGQAMAALRQRLPLSPTVVDGAAMARALGRVTALHAGFQFRLGEFDLARQRAEEALALLEPLRPQRDAGHARLYLGAAWYGLGDLTRSVQWFLAATEAYEEADHPWGIGAALDNAGYLESLRGNPAAAEVHLRRGLAIAQQTGSRYLLTGIYDHLATLMAAQGRFAEAMTYVDRCHHVLKEMDRPYIVASLSLSLSQIALQAGDLAAAEEYVGRALQIARDSGNQFDLARFLIQAGAGAMAAGDLAAAGAAYAAAVATAQAIHAEGLLAEAQAGLAGCAAG